MNWKKNALTALAISAIGGTTVACGPGTEPGDDPDDGMTISYIVSTADVPEPDMTTGNLPGFDLDGMNSAGTSDNCNDAPDFTSSISGATGVDNQLGANVIGLLGDMLGPDGVQGAVREQIASGSFLLILKVHDIDNFNNDESVSVDLVLGAASGAITLGSDGLIAPGQTFTSMRALGTISGASISGGRLTVSADTLPLTLAVSGNEVTLNLTSARISGTITATAMTRGEIGAQISVAEIVTLGEMLAPGTITEDLVRSVAMPDLDPSADPTVCDAISAGLTFEATTANF